MRKGTIMQSHILNKLEYMLSNGSKSDKIIMHYFLSDFPITALGNLPSIAEKCGVSLATVQRCVVKLGYKGFTEFHQDMLKSLEYYQNSSPLERLTDAKHQSTNMYYHRNIDNITNTFANINPQIITHAVELLAQKDHTVYCVGGRFTGVLVRLFARNLKTIRPKVIETHPYEGFLLDILNNCDKKSILIITDIRRYDMDLLGLSKLAKTEQQATIILLTDTWMSPIHQYADIIIPVFTGTDACWDSNVAMLTMLEEIMGQLTIRLGKSAEKYLSRREFFRNKGIPEKG